MALNSHPSPTVEEDELVPREVSHRLELLTQLRVEISLLEMGNASGPELDSHTAQMVSQATRLADAIETLVHTCGLGPIGQQATHRLWARLDPLLRSTFLLQLRESVAHILNSAREHVTSSPVSASLAPQIWTLSARWLQCVHPLLRPVCRHGAPVLAPLPGLHVRQRGA